MRGFVPHTAPWPGSGPAMPCSGLRACPEASAAHPAPAASAQLAKPRLSGLDGSRHRRSALVVPRSRVGEAAPRDPTQVSLAWPVRELALFPCRSSTPITLVRAKPEPADEGELSFGRDGLIPELLKRVQGLPIIRSDSSSSSGGSHSTQQQQQEQQQNNNSVQSAQSPTRVARRPRARYPL